MIYLREEEEEEEEDTGEGEAAEREERTLGQELESQRHW